jgi:hypothetical protein
MPGVLSLFENDRGAVITCAQEPLPAMPDIEIGHMRHASIGTAPAFKTVHVGGCKLSTVDRQCSSISSMTRRYPADNPSTMQAK